jgi:hypothetical protein
VNAPTGIATRSFDLSVVVEQAALNAIADATFGQIAADVATKLGIAGPEKIF